MTLSRLPVLTLLLVVAAPASAQVVPGPKDDFDAAAAQFRAYALNGFQEVVAEWLEAVNEHDAEEAAGFYTEDAVTQVPFPGRGRASIEKALGRWLAGVDEVRLGLSDFDASGMIAYGTLQVRLYEVGGKQPREGRMLLVARRSGSDWRIRAQTLILTD